MMINPPHTYTAEVRANLDAAKAAYRVGRLAYDFPHRIFSELWDRDVASSATLQRITNPALKGRLAAQFRKSYEAYLQAAYHSRCSCENDFDRDYFLSINGEHYRVDAIENAVTMTDHYRWWADADAVEAAQREAA